MEWEQNKFCFFISLRKGCLIIGYLSLLANIAALIAGFVTKKDIVAKTSDEVAEYSFKLSISMFHICMINRTLSIVFTIVLLVGLHKNKRHFIKIYLIFMLISVLITTIVFIWKASMGASVMDMFCLLMCILFLAYYCLVIIASYYVKMRRSIVPTSIENTAARTTGTVPTAPPESDIS